MKRTAYWVQAIVVPLLFCSCGSVLGWEHNYVAARDLKPGISESECLAVLARGGQVKLEEDLAIDMAEQHDLTVEDPQLREALDKAEQETGRYAVRSMRVSRTWGFLGLGVYHLFLDVDDELVGYHLWHIN